MKPAAKKVELTDSVYKLTAQDLPVLSATGYIFTGWSLTDPDAEDTASGEASSSGAETSTETAAAVIAGEKISQDTTLYALWSVNPYSAPLRSHYHTIKYIDIDGSEISGLSPSGFWETDSVDFSSAVPLDPNEYTRYTFAGWSLSSSVEDKTSGLEANTRTGNVTLYALWTSAAEHIKSLSEDSTVAVKGELTGDELSALSTAIKDASCKIALDLSGTTGLEEIAYKQFQENTNLSGIALPGSVESIEGYAFDGCSSLSSIAIPATVTKIGYGAFRKCSALSSVVIPSSVTSIEGYAFEGTSLTSVEIGSGVTSIGNYAFAYCTSLKSIAIPDSVTSIERNAFCSCSSLASVELGNGVTSIGRWAFELCTSLEKITIPSNVTKIAYRAFSYSSNLASVTFEDTEGWYYTSSSDYTGGTAFSSSDLADTSKAAKYLHTTYKSYYWYKQN